MNVIEFLNKLNTFFPSDETNEVFDERLNEYAKSIVNKAQIHGCQYDYNKAFSYLLENYKYKTFPSLRDILETLSKSAFKKADYSGREGEVIKRVINGMEYEFTIIPNHWEKVKTISEVNAEIRRRTNKEIA